MAITPYTTGAYAEFTPLTMQEIFQPALIQRERHNAIEEQYAELATNAAKASFIADQARLNGDTTLANQYSNYRNSLEQSSNDLLERGVTDTSRANMFNLRSRYQSEIQPMISGYELRNQDIQNYNTLVTKDPTYIGVNPATRSVSDYISNGLAPYTQQGVSGANLTAQTSEIASKYAQILQSGSDELRPVLEDAFGPQYYERIKRFGFIPGTEEAATLESFIRNQVLTSNNVNDSWASSDQITQATSFINQGMASLIGKQDSDYVRDLGREYRQQLELQKIAARQAAKGQAGSGSQISPILLPGNVSYNEEVQSQIKTYRQANTQDNPLNIALKSKTGKEFEETYNNTIGKKWNAPLDATGAREMSAAIDLRNATMNMSEEDAQAALGKLRQTEYWDAAWDAMNYNSPNELVNYAMRALGPARVLPVLGGYVAGFLPSGDTRQVNPERIAENYQKLADMQAVATKANFIQQSAATQGITLSEDEVHRLVEADMLDRATLTQSVLNFSGDEVNNEQKQEAMSYVSDLRRSGAIITKVNKKGKTEKILASEINRELSADVLKEFEPNKLNFKGHVSLNRDLGMRPSYQFTKTVGNDTYYIDVPATSLDNQYASSKAIYSIIDSGVTEPTPIQTSTGERLVVIPRLGTQGIDYTIYNPVTKTYSTAEAYLNRDRESVGQWYYSRGRTRKEAQ